MFDTDADPLPWTMLVIVALVVSASASGLGEGGARPSEVQWPRAVVRDGPGTGACARDPRMVDCGKEPMPEVLRLPAAAFQPGSAELPEALLRPLRQIGQTLREQHAVVRVEVHTDASGRADGNRALSQRRAEAIRSFLIGTGVDPDRVQAAGMGASRPLDSGDPLAPGNRRIEIVRL